jgi:hypothetical protein
MFISVKIPHLQIGRKKMAIGIVMSVRLSVCLSPELEERDSYQKDILLMSCCGILIKLSVRFLSCEE